MGKVSTENRDGLMGAIKPTNIHIEIPKGDERNRKGKKTYSKEPLLNTSLIWRKKTVSRSEKNREFQIR